MQATNTTTRRFDTGSIKSLAIAAGLIASFAIGAAAITNSDQLPVIGGSDARVVAAPQLTSDDLYAFEASLSNVQVDGWAASVAQPTSDDAFAYEASLELARATAANRTLSSDEGYALEVAQVALAAARHNAATVQLTSDEAWAIEQAQLLAGSDEQRAGR